MSAGLASIIQRRRSAAGGSAKETGLLPAPWRVGFSRLWWRYTDQDLDPLDSDLTLLELCTQPLAAWPVRLDLSITDLQNSLLVDGDLTEFAVQGSRLARHDVEAEWIENQVHAALRDAASANGSSDEEIEHAYAALRRYLIDHAVVADREVRNLERRFPEKDTNAQTYVLRLINLAYHARPAREPQEYLLCPQCGNVRSDTLASCATAGCPSGTPQPWTAKPLAVIYEQHRATRKYIHDPGLVEARIIDALSVDSLAWMVRVTPYPRVDALDVLIEFLLPGANGVPQVVETWGVDAKDQVSARLLGRGFTWPQTPACDRRYLALPAHRAVQPGYISDLEAELDGRVAGVHAIDENQLVARVKERVKELAA
ncbi:hypothetical protein ACIBF5_06840 [Micromonospora sp. NPDC050417]|uniref:restriction endonuclease-related protein n=1 Tax=Micromonospora sp. NPDC050417 TaxID=3364280 RepID=UPI0037B89E93